MSKKILLISLMLLAMTACGENYDERFDAGYSDGYAAGYNTTCEIRATLIEGDWDSEGYSAGYTAGKIDGSEQCRADRK